MSQIKFGTDGWRGRIADDFTFDNVGLVTQALIDHLQETGLAAKGVFVGYDNRFQSEDFARTAAELCSGAGLDTILSEHSVPSPVTSYTVNRLGLGAGIMITASHNPPEWNGFKIKETFGGSAFPATTQAVEKKLRPELAIAPSAAKLKTLDPDREYLDKISSLVDIELVRNSGIAVVFDPMFGSGAGYFAKLGVPAVEIRGKRDPLFGGVNPEPLPVNLEESISFVKETALKERGRPTVCIVVDGDADRIAAIDGSGRFINTHNIFCLLLRYLVVHRQLTGEVVKTFNLSNLIDKLCRQYDRRLTVTPIGFKHIAKLIMERDIILGGEESGGMGVKGNIPERDGLLAGLMLIELMAREKKTLAQIMDGIMDEHGYFYYDRIDIHTDKALSLVQTLTKNPLKELGGQPIVKVETLDGLKFHFADESWILFRASGTEPLLRVYAEGRSPEKLRLILGAGESLVPR